MGKNDDGKRKRGRPKLRVTDGMREAVCTMRMRGLDVDTVAKLVINPDSGKPIGKSTLYKYFRAEMELGKHYIGNRAAAELFRRAMDQTAPQSTACLIFLLKTQFGFAERGSSVDATPEETARRISEAMGFARRPDDEGEQYL